MRSYVHHHIGADSDNKPYVSVKQDVVVIHLDDVQIPTATISISRSNHAYLHSLIMQLQNAEAVVGMLDVDGAA